MTFARDNLGRTYEYFIREFAEGASSVGLSPAQLVQHHGASSAVLDRAELLNGPA